MDNVLNPMMMKSLGSLLRWALSLAVPFFVSKGIWTPDEATAMMTGIAGALAALIWSLLEKRNAQKMLVTAQATPGPVSQSDLKQIIKDGPTPPVSLPKDVTPRMI
ncbi:MAG TPA: hypothetical protein VK504_03985 [Vicinamibacterales bacterium]|nr:hypothetical protein [Vicinamibacterales bacterium]